MKIAKQRRAAQEFVKKWSGKRKELGQDEQFWTSLLRDVYGVKKPEEVIDFKVSIPSLDKSTKFLDGYIIPSKTLIEQKAWGKNLDTAYTQSDGAKLTPYQQARRYSELLSYSKTPRWIIVSNFEEFRLYDKENPTTPPTIVKLEELPEKASYFNFLVDEHSLPPNPTVEISVKAGDIISEIYEALLKQYKNPDSPKTLESLNILCVRLVFLMYAQSAGLLDTSDALNAYLEQSNKVGAALRELFKVLDTPYEKRSELFPYLEEEDPILANMPYINGGLFANENIEIPAFTPEIRDLLIKKALEIDFSKISPTIFGSIFESCLDPVRRRSAGAHYTSLENIHKIIDPLFLDELKDELNDIMKLSPGKRKDKRLHEFQNKLAEIRILDPAAGSGNFLTESYIWLRRLENQVIEELNKGSIAFNFGDLIRVSINQFYGIEINDFAVAVAKTALWIAESQLFEETKAILQEEDIDFFPLKTYPNIVEGNALRTDWETVVQDKKRLSYIIGNPPFNGARTMSKEQKSDVVNTFGSKWKNVGNLDYVSCWFKEAADFIADTDIRCAFVATSSICQGEQVNNLWKALLDNGIHIDFAWRPFKWESESLEKAQVWCVIVGFSKADNSKPKLIDGEKVKNINAYLANADNFFIKNRNSPISGSPRMAMGNQPIDGGNYLFTQEEMEEFIKKEPASAEWFKPWYGAKEFINQKPRYCLYLAECPPEKLREMPECLKRVQAVRETRLASKATPTRKLADTPLLFNQTNIPTGTYIAIPEVSSSLREYIPIGYMDSSSLCSNKLRIMPDANLYHFGVLTSRVHMSWVRTICGRLKNDYDYSIKGVYNNFPWPDPTSEQKKKIEQTAQGILEVRKLYPKASLADLYDPAAMPTDLRKAHEANDRAVMEAYGFKENLDEPEIVAKLFNLYKKIDAA